MDESDLESAGTVRRDPLFKGCTRPAMLMGVPMLPMMLVVGLTVILSVWTYPLAMFALVPVEVVIMRAIVRDDDQMFRLLGLKFRCRGMYLNRNASFWKCSAYAPIAYPKRKKRK